MAPPQGILFSIGGMDVTATGAAIGIGGTVLLVALISIGAVVVVKRRSVQTRRVSDPSMPTRMERGVSLEKIGKFARAASDLAADRLGTSSRYNELDELGTGPFGEGPGGRKKGKAPPTYTQTREKGISFTQSLQTTEL